MNCCCKYLIIGCLVVIVTIALAVGPTIWFISGYKINDLQLYTRSCDYCGQFTVNTNNAAIEKQCCSGQHPQECKSYSYCTQQQAVYLNSLNHWKDRGQVGTYASIIVLLLPLAMLLLALCGSCETKMMGVCIFVGGSALLILPIYLAIKIERINAVTQLSNNNCSFCGITTHDKGDGKCCDRLGWFATCISYEVCTAARESYMEQLKNELKMTMVKLSAIIAVSAIVLILIVGLPQDCKNGCRSCCSVIGQRFPRFRDWLKRLFNYNQNDNQYQEIPRHQLRGEDQRHLQEIQARLLLLRNNHTHRQEQLELIERLSASLRNTTGIERRSDQRRRLPILGQDYRARTHATSPETCTICLSAIQQRRIGRLICGHVFHQRCILPWLQRYRTCPICRTRHNEEALLQ